MSRPEDEHPFDEALRRMPRHRISEEVAAEHLRMLREQAEKEAARIRGRSGLVGSPRSRKRRVAIALAALIALLGASVGTAAALGVFSAKPSDRRTAVCYATTDLSVQDNHFDIAVAAPGGGNPSQGDAARAAVDICRGAWEQGRLASAEPFVSLDPKPPPWNYPVPPLVVCVLKSGQVGVFPGTSDVCRTLGLPTAVL